MRAMFSFVGLWCMISLASGVHAQNYSEVKFDASGSLGSAWFGGDTTSPGSCSSCPRNVGQGQSILIETSMRIDSFSFYYAGFADDSGLVALDIRTSDGIIIKSDTAALPGSFFTDWFTWRNLNLNVLNGTLLIFTSYVIDGEVSGAVGGIRGDIGQNYTPGVRYTRSATSFEGSPPYDMTTWLSWSQNAWDAWFWVQGTSLSPREVDSLSLIELYDNTDGNNWIDNLNWKTSNPISDWAGVSLSNGRVSQLSLRFNGLTGSLPASFGNLDALTSLMLDNNQLTGPLPTEIGNLVNCQTIWLHNNDFTGLIPGSLTDLASATNILLNNNRLSGAIPDSIGKLVQLTLLDLGVNILSGTIPASVGSMNSLVQLYLNRNLLSGKIPAEIGSLTNLQKLWIFENQISDSIPDSFTGLSAITEIWADENRLTYLPDLSAISGLAILRVASNRLTFGDLEPNVGITDFTYVPQDSVGEYSDTTLTEGSGITFRVNTSGSASVYQWYKDGQPISAANADTLELAAVDGADAGTYHCQITNSIATGLTLVSRATTLNVDLLTAIGDGQGVSPASFALHQNYPNPFNPTTTIRFEMTSRRHILLAVYNQVGRKVRTLRNGMAERGIHTIQWDGTSDRGTRVSSGVYFYRLQAKDNILARKMILLK